MFSKLRQMIADLGEVQETDFYKYQNAIKSRKLLKDIILEVKGLRERIMKITKDNNPKLFARKPKV